MMNNKKKRRRVLMNDKELWQELRVAVSNEERIVVFLSHPDKRIKGFAELTSDTNRIKILTEEGPVWVPIKNIESISRVVRLRIQGTMIE